jgi:xanthine dehydrogenase accessory factor
MAVPTALEVLAEVERALEEHPRVVLCQIVRSQGSTPGKLGWKMVVRPGGEGFGNLGGGAFEALVKRDAAALLADGGESRVQRYYLTEEAVHGQPTGMVCGGMIEVFLEILAGPPMLVICGGGPVGQALARQAALGPFEIAVADDRAEFRRQELFPEGVHRLAVDREYGADFLARWSHRQLLVAIVSRCWETDLAAAAAVLRQSPPGLCYLGLMGSRRKVERVERELDALGLDLDGVSWHAPIGIPQGGSTPAESAVSIAAEMVQVRSRGGRAAGGSTSSQADGAVRLV